MCCHSLNKYWCVWPSKLEIRWKMVYLFMYLFIYCASCSLLSRHRLFSLDVGLLYAYVLWGFCCAFSLKISEWTALKGLQGIHFKRHVEYHKTFRFMRTAFAFKVLWIPLWCSHLLSGPVLPHPFFPSSVPTPEPNSLCFWGTVEPVGDPQLSGAEWLLWVLLHND